MKSTRKYFRRFRLILRSGKYPTFWMGVQLFIKYNKIIEYLSTLKNFRYLISGIGVNKQNAEHFINIYVEFKNKNSISITHLQGVQVITTIYSQSFVIEYIQKQNLGILDEIGTKATHQPTKTLDKLKRCYSF